MRKLQRALNMFIVVVLSTFYHHKSVHTALLKEVNNGERQVAIFMKGFIRVLRFVYYRHTVFQLCFTKFVVSINKYRNNSFQYFNRSVKASASTRKNRDVMAYISIYSFNRKCIILVANIANMLPRIDISI